MASASLKDSMLASALESLNIENYWPTFDSHKDLDTCDDSEYSIILCFYECLLDDLIHQSRLQSDNIQAAINILVRSHGQINNGKMPDDLNYNNYSNCIGYLHRYAACHTALVHTVMLKIFHVNPPAEMRRMLALKDQLRAICLGSGPGNDFVGLLSALYGRHFGLLNIDITVVDKMFGWRSIFEETDRRLRLGLCGNASKTCAESNVRSHFMNADLKVPVEWSEDFKRKLSSADLITLVKFLSVVPKADKLLILRNVVLSMKPGSLLVFIDCPYPNYEFQALEPYLKTVYEATKEKFDFNFEVSRFGFPNITTSRAYVRVFMRKFVNVVVGSVPR